MEPVPALPATSRRSAAEADTGGPLPSLDTLVQRIPGPARDLLEELFRAKFVAVKRMPATALKP